jgi:quercetin dioxygenase-like cupin family protein
MTVREGQDEMKQLIATAMAFAFFWAAPAKAQHIEITTHDSRGSVAGPASNFTGSVSQEPLFRAPDKSKISVGLVTFAAGARTAWHTHPAGQILVVTSGSGWIQELGGERRDIKPGDVVWIPPGIKHWHGAGATSAMSHISIVETVEGKTADWKEQVGDEQYGH